MSTLKFIPPRVPFTDPRTGTITREWYMFLQGVFDRVGGATGESTAELQASMFEDAGIEETKASLYGLRQDWEQEPRYVAPAAEDDLAPSMHIEELNGRVIRLETSGSGGGHVIEDEGVPVTQRATLNFVGAGVSVTDSGGKTEVAIAGGGGGGGDSYFPGGW